MPERPLGHGDEVTAGRLGHAHDGVTRPPSGTAFGTQPWHRLLNWWRPTPAPDRPRAFPSTDASNADDLASLKMAECGR